MVRVSSSRCVCLMFFCCVTKCLARLLLNSKLRPNNLNCRLKTCWSWWRRIRSRMWLDFPGLYSDSFSISIAAEWREYHWPDFTAMLWGWNQMLCVKLRFINIYCPRYCAGHCGREEMNRHIQFLQNRNISKLRRIKELKILLMWEGVITLLQFYLQSLFSFFDAYDEVFRGEKEKCLGLTLKYFPSPKEWRNR